MGFLSMKIWYKTSYVHNVLPTSGSALVSPWGSAPPFCPLLFPLFDSGVDFPDSGVDFPDSGVDFPDSGVDFPDSGVDFSGSAVDFSGSAVEVLPFPLFVFDPAPIPPSGVDVSGSAVDPSGSAVVLYLPSGSGTPLVDSGSAVDRSGSAVALYLPSGSGTPLEVVSGSDVAPSGSAVTL